MLEVVVWDFKGEESNSHEDGKAMFDKQRFAGQTTGQGDTEWTVVSRPCSVSLTILCPYSLQRFLLIALITLFQEEFLYLNFFRQLGRWSKFFLSLLGFNCFQLEIITSRYFGGANFAPFHGLQWRSQNMNGLPHKNNSQTLEVGVKAYELWDLQESWGLLQWGNPWGPHPYFPADKAWDIWLLTM